MHMSLSSWTTDAIDAGLIVALTALGLIVASVLIGRVLKLATSLRRVNDARRQQLVTLVHALRWLVNTILVGVGLMMLLSTLGVNVGPVLASAGVVGLAVSLGAQSLIKDVISGILILAENQYSVGDVIQVGSVSGQVEQTTLRTTHLRGLDGSLVIVPNGEVRIVTNQTRDWSRAMVDIGVAYEEDLDRVLSVLEESVAAFGKDPARASELVEPPEVVGPLSLGDWAITVRLMVKTPPGKQWQVARELRRFVLAVCEREGISLPYPRQEVWVRTAEPSLGER
jgi:small-conductance mechanosensitive channel